MKRRVFLTGIGAGLASLGLGTLGRAATQGATGRLPNIVFILADDLGYAELGCYGQQKIRTPNIDALAAAGMRFTDAYSGNPVCAPSRCSFLTGKHDGHAFVRDNYEIGTWDSYQGQLPLPEGTVTIARILKDKGYATACIGKWGLGRAGSSGDPQRQGFDLFFGYNCQRQAHNYYPRYLERNGEHVTLDGNDRGLTGRQYAPDLMGEEALAFIEQHRSQPFFLYFATPVPHVALQVPEDSLNEYPVEWDTRPYQGKQGYLPHPRPRAAYAAMVTRMDRDVGRILAKLDTLGLSDNTLVIFTSDNGPTFNGGSDSAFFESAGPLRGLKCSLYEGGIRVPLIARWPDHIPAGTVTHQQAAFWDMLPTFAALAGAATPPGIDGISLLPTLEGHADQQTQHEYLYWERKGTNGGGQALRWGNWKGLRTGLLKNPDAPLVLYNLADDIGETQNVAAEHPDVVAKVMAMIKDAHVASPEFPLYGNEPH